MIPRYDTGDDMNQTQQTQPGRQGITAEEVAAAAEAIAAEGGAPSIRNVRDRLGTGSPNTISRHLNTWRDARPKQATVKQELPEELATAFAQHLSRTVDAATAEVRSELVQARHEVQDLAKDGEELEAALEAATQNAQQLAEERDAAQAEAVARSDEIRRLTEAVAREQAAAEAARTEVATARVTLDTQADQLNQLKAELSEQATSHKEERSALLQSLDAAKEQAQEARQAAAVAAAQEQAQRERSTELQAELTALKHQLAQAQADTQAAREKAQAEADAIRQQAHAETVRMQEKVEAAQAALLQLAQGKQKERNPKPAEDQQTLGL